MMLIDKSLAEEVEFLLPGNVFISYYNIYASSIMKIINRYIPFMICAK